MRISQLLSLLVGLAFLASYNVEATTETLTPSYVELESNVNHATMRGQDHDIKDVTDTHSDDCVLEDQHGCHCIYCAFLLSHSPTYTTHKQGAYYLPLLPTVSLVVFPIDHPPQ